MTNPVHAVELEQHRAYLRGEEGWLWRKPSRVEHFRRCTFCGSINPEDLVAEPEWHPNWADQKYGWPHKFYVDIPDRKGKLDWLGGSTEDMSDEELARYGWKRVKDLNRKERKALKDANLVGEYAVVGIGTRAVHHAKFYTEHLADPRVSQEVKGAIYQRSGLVIEFRADGHIEWRPAG